MPASYKGSGSASRANKYSTVSKQITRFREGSQSSDPMYFINQAMIEIFR